MRDNGDEVPTLVCPLADSGMNDLHVPRRMIDNRASRRRRLAADPFEVRRGCSLYRRVF